MTSQSRHPSAPRKRLLSAVIGQCLALGMAGGAQAANIFVDSGEVEVVDNGRCSIIEAITNANGDNVSGSADCAAGSGTDLIVLPASSLFLFSNSVGDLNGPIALPGILTPIEIEGNGATLRREESAADFRLIYNQSTLTIRNTALENGRAVQGFAGGGGILNLGTLELVDSSISNSFAGVLGGAISSENYGTATITNSTLFDNVSGLHGGAVSSRGAPESTLRVYDSTIVNNSAANQGGGILSGYGTSQLVIRNSTITRNIAGAGGGVANRIPGDFTITNATLADNIAPAGGNLWTEYAYGVGNLRNSILSGAGTDDCVISGGDALAQNLNNLIEDGSCSNGATNLVTGDPSLRGLDRNGGPTRTRALDDPSPANGTGNNAICPGADQRGAPRSDGACDIGAFEWHSPIYVDAGIVDVDSGDGQCSLREAMNNANNDGQFSANADECEPGVVNARDHVVLPSNVTFTVSDANPSGYGPIDYRFGLPSIANNMVISGNGSTITRDDNEPDGIGLFVAVGTSAEFVLQDMTVSNAGGYLAPYGPGLDMFLGATGTVLNSTFERNRGTAGAAIYVNGTLTLDNVTLTGNTGGQGAIRSNDGSVSINYSRITDNTITNTGGGGIFCTQADLTIANSTISGNSAEFEGGGIENVVCAIDIRSSTLHNNRSGVDGGAINNYGGLINITNSTLSGNTATGTGGGIHSRDGTVSILNSTIALNSAASGLGIQNDVNSVLEFTNTLVVNGLTYESHCDSQGTIAVNSGNLVEDESCEPDFAGAPGLVDLVAPLADNGGLTLTHDLLFTMNRAIDNGDEGVCPEEDQRGDPRPNDGNGDTVARCDIGAVEYRDELDPEVTGSAAADVATAGETSYEFMVSYGDDSSILESSIDIDDVEVSGPGGTLTPVSVSTATVTGTQFTATYTITPPGGAWDPDDDGLYTISLRESQVTDIFGKAVPSGEVTTFTVNIPEPEIVVRGNNMEIVDGDLTPSDQDGTDFGQVFPGSTVARTFTIENTGDADLEISSVNITAIGFEVSSGPGQTTLGPNEETTFEVTFNPQTPGSFGGVLAISNSDQDEGVYDFAIEGEAVTDPDLIFADNFGTGDDQPD